MSSKKERLQPEVIISCLDVLCRANVSVSGSDPRLAADISQAIDSLSAAMQDIGADDAYPQKTLKMDATRNIKFKHEEIVDVLTNEVVSLRKS